MIRLFLIGIVSNCALLSGNAQFSYFNNLFVESNEAGGLCTNLISEGDSLFAIGSVITDVNYDYLLSIRHLDYFGNLAYNDLTEIGFFYVSKSDAINKMVTEDNYVYGTARASSCALLKLNEQFDTLWTTDFLPQNAAINFFAQAKEYDGSIYASGTNGVDTDNNGNTNFNALLLCRFDYDGELLEEHQFELFLDDFGCVSQRFFPLGNNEFLFTGVQGSSGEPLSPLLAKGNTETGDAEPYFLDDSGLVLYHPIYPLAFQKAGGSIVVCYGYPNSLLFNDDEHPNVSIRMFEFDTETMQPVEEVIVLPELNTYAKIYDLLETPDGGYALCGETAIVEYTNPNDPNSVTSWETYGFILKVDSMFQHEWTELYQYPELTPDAFLELHTLWDIELTNDDGFAAVGTWMDNNSPPQRTWVIKTDCKGKLELPQLSFSAEIVQSGDTVVGMSTGSGVWNYQWDFGNGNVSQNDTANFVFTQPGEYTVIASSSYCAMTIDSTFTIQILDCAGNTTTPSLAINPLYTQVDFTTEVQFTSMPENLIEVQWNFGGDWVVGNEQTWLFPSPGAFEVLVQGMYCDSVFTDTLNIVLTDCAGNIETPPLSLTPTNLALNDSTFVFDCTPDNLTNITWNFGDGAFSFGTNTEHTYLSTGEFEVVVCGEYCDSLFCDTLFVTATVGMHEQASQNHSFVIVPNPVIQNEFEIRGSTIIQSVRVMDLTGQVIVEQAAQSRNVKMFVPSLAVGTYILEVIHADGFIEYDKILVK